MQTGHQLCHLFVTILKGGGGGSISESAKDVAFGKGRRGAVAVAAEVVDVKGVLVGSEMAGYRARGAAAVGYKAVPGGYPEEVSHPEPAGCRRQGNGGARAYEG
jgi:hypothetical protein